MNKAAARVAAIAKAFGGIVKPWKGTFRIVEVFDDDPVPVPGPDEEFLVLNIIRTPERAASISLPVLDDGGNGHGDADLAAEVERLQAERDRLKTERRSAARPRSVQIIGGIQGAKGKQ
jgi:hypothetical protein